MTVSEYIQKKAPLSLEQALDFESRFTTKSAKSGEYIIEEGEVCRKILFLQKGCIAMIGNTVGFGLGVISKNDKWDVGIRYYGRSGPINLHKEYELVLPAGETYKGQSSVMLGVDHVYLGLEAAYSFTLGKERLSVRIPVSFGQLGAGFYLKGEDRFTPDGQRTSVWEDKLQGGSDAGFGFCSEFGAQLIYQISPKNEHIHLMVGASYMNTYGYESFLGGTGFYNNKIRATIGFRFDI